MDKLMVTRPRTRFGAHFRGLRRSRRNSRAPEHTPRREGMRGSNGSKFPSEYFAPLLRFLQKRVGTPWDEVYSEIRKRLNPRSAVHMHVMVHLDQFVVTRTWIQEGQVWGHVWEEAMRLDSRRVHFFVCPKSGFLDEPRPTKRRHSVEARVRDIRILGPARRAIRIDGLWFEIYLAPLAPSPHFDVVLRREVTSAEWAQLMAIYGCSDQYGVSKRAMSKREIAHAQTSPCGKRTESFRRGRGL